MTNEWIPSPTKGEGLIEVTQHKKYSDYWIAKDGRIFEKNRSGSFKQINQEFERFQDKGEPKTRLHSEFGKVVEYEKKRAFKVFNSTEIESYLPPSFSYDYPSRDQRINNELKQEMINQEQLAKKILEKYAGQIKFN